MKLKPLLTICLYLATLALPLAALAGDITYETFPGKYILDASALGQKALVHVNVKAGQKFEVVLEDEEGMGQVCDGTYTLGYVNNQDGDNFSTDLVMAGKGSCPDNREKVVTVEVNMKNAQKRNLEKGTYVTIFSSELNMTVHAKMKKQQ